MAAALHSNSRQLKVTGFRDPFHVVRDSVDCLHPPGSIPSRTRFSECVSPLSRHLSLLVQLFTLASDTVFILAGSLIQTLGDRRSPAFVTHAFHTPLSSVTAVSPWLITCTLQGLYLIGPGFPNACYHSVGTSPLLVYCLLLHWLSRPISYPPVICDSSIPLVDYLHPPGSTPIWTMCVLVTHMVLLTFFVGCRGLIFILDDWF